jgi:hypothetical protein
MKLTFEKLNENQFTNTLVRLSNENGFADFKATYNVAKLYRRVQKELKVARDLHLKLLEKYAEKDENGNFVPQPNARAPYKIKPECEEAYEKEMEEFMATEFEVDCQPLKASQLGSVRVTPADIVALGDVFEIDEEIVSPSS